MSRVALTKLPYLFFVIVLACAAIFAGVSFERWWQAEYENDSFKLVEDELFAIKDTINLNLQRHFQLITGLSGLVALNPNLTESQFNKAVAHMTHDDWDIRSVAAAPDLVIKYTYPKEGNETILGFDYRQSDAQYDAVRRTVELKQPLLAGPVNLIQGGRGLVARMPVFLTDEDGADSLWGIVSTVIDMEDFFHLNGLPSRKLNIAIKGKDSQGEAGAVIYGQAKLFDNPKLTTELIMPSGKWLIAAEPVDGWGVLSNDMRWQPYAVYSGLFVIFLMLLIPLLLIYQHQRSHYRFVRLIEDSPIPYLIINNENKAEYINDAFISLYGYQLADLNKKESWFILFKDKKSIHSFFSEQDADQSNSDTIYVEAKIKTKRASECVAVLSISKPDLDASEAKVIAFNDITNTRNAMNALKQSHEELTQSETFLSNIMQSLPLLVWLKDPEGKYLACNKEFELFYGAKQADIIGKSDYDFVDEETANFFRQKDLRAISQNRPTKNEETLTYASDGHQATFETIKTPLKDAKGDIVGVLGVAQDITELKQWDASLRLASMVYSSSSEAMVVTDLKSTIVSVNPAFTEVTGYTAEEAQGQKISLLSSGRHDKNFYIEMWAAIKKNGYWEGEIFNKRKNGDIYPQFIRINTIFDEHGIEPAHYVGLFHDRSNEHKARDKIWRQAHFDSLTQLPNRKYIVDYLDREIQKAQRHKFQIAVLFLDLDGFKDVNDSFGHTIGDKLLQKIADKLDKIIRREDLAGRQGGDEFTIVMSDLTERQAAIRVAGEINAALAEPVEVEQFSLHITSSIGISFYPEDGLNSTELLKQSDQAMYAAKQAGKNQFHCFTNEMQEAVLRRMHIIEELHTALSEQQFELYYQPIVDARTGQLYKAEALIRWIHPERGLIPPSDFIPIAEETGLICDMGHWVYITASNAVMAFKKHFGEFELSFNISPVQLNSERCMSMAWDKSRQEQTSSDAYLIAEITETLLLNSEASVQELLESFRQKGFKIALDDFGTGYSSLSYLQAYDIDFMKIDRRFVDKLSLDTSSYSLCEAMILMAHKLGMKVIAEGVETAEQMSLLKEMGCDYLQGYYFSKPIPYKDFMALDATYFEKQCQLPANIEV